MTFIFHRHTPSGTLKDFVQALWYARGTINYTREKIAPTGSSVAVINLGDPLKVSPLDNVGSGLVVDSGFLTGPHDRPIINEPQGETHAVGIVATPIGTRTLFNTNPVHIRGQVLNLADVIPNYSTVHNNISNQASHEAMFLLLEKWLTEKLTTTNDNHSRCQQAISIIEATPNAPIAAIAEQLAITPEHFNREFVKITGLTPRAYARIHKLRAILSTLDVRLEIDWLAIATDNGWYDQSHFIRDFKRHTGATPTEYQKAQRELLSEEELSDAYGFTPES